MFLLPFLFCFFFAVSQQPWASPGPWVVTCHFFVTTVQYKRLFLGLSSLVVSCFLFLLYWLLVFYIPVIFSLVLLIGWHGIQCCLQPQVPALQFIILHNNNTTPISLKTVFFPLCSPPCSYQLSHSSFIILIVFNIIFTFISISIYMTLTRSTLPTLPYPPPTNLKA